MKKSISTVLFLLLVLWACAQQEQKPSPGALSKDPQRARPANLQTGNGVVSSRRAADKTTHPRPIRPAVSNEPPSSTRKANQ